ncbi:DUF927 domain-containing protein [Methylobacterium bullatum]|uniref:DUF927 domain-containing protein n=1 Tax=Methylobacterium bullatum TaxID=570505 RepID=UPI00177B5F19|nr:DUF927 domain-containing protein [Methylobacterium bullatum]
MIDQEEDRWVRYGTPTRALWIRVSEFTRTDVFSQLANIDPSLIEPAAQRALRSEVAKVEPYRSAFVAGTPGWIEGHFVLGDGGLLQPPLDPREVIVTFPRNSKFAACGSLAEWQAGIGPIVARQPLALFALSVAFVGPLLPFVPPDYLSPLFELVGDPGCGKSTLGMLAASVWAGDRNSNCGGGETWNLTPGRFDETKLAHRHMLLLLDEANLAGASKEARKQLIHQAVFGLSNTGQRQRSGDQLTKPHAHLAVLSTSNRCLSDLIEGSEAERGALTERMVTISIARERSYGVLDHLPSGYSGAAAAVEALRAASNEHWGTAGTAFIERMQGQIARDEEAFRGTLKRVLDRHREALSADIEKERVRKCFALVALAGMLARRWGIIPKAWGSSAPAVYAVAREAAGNQKSRSQSASVTPIQQIRTYFEKHRTDVVDVSTLQAPLSKVAFEATAGFVKQVEGATELMIPARRFQEAFPQHEALMRVLRDDGQARTESGRKPKLTIKTPRAICGDGRVYCVKLDMADPEPS